MKRAARVLLVVPLVGLWLTACDRSPVAPDASPARYDIVAAANSPPIVGTNTGLVVAPGGSGTLTTTQLQTFDVDDYAADLAYQITSAPEYGILNEASFTQAQIDGGAISYDHDGGPQVRDRFCFRVSDPAGGRDLGVFHIGIGEAPALARFTQNHDATDAPVIDWNTGLTIASGAESQLVGLLSSTDPSYYDANLTYSLTAQPRYGVIQRNGTATDQFSEADLVGGLVTYQHDGSVSSSDDFCFLVENPDGKFDGGVFQVTVLGANSPPTSDPNGPYLGALGSLIAFDGTGSSDPDGGPLTYDWNWGDSNSDLDAGPTPSHGYSDAGIYDVCLTVIDSEGESDSECTSAVVYDPTGGFVTGGGWIYSEPGNYVDDPLVEGKANFGFVSKYKKGATIPTGNTEFQFKAGDLNFHSSSYDFLVINQGGRRAQYKGSGTINGSVAPNGQEFRFIIWAQDDDVDTFRIMIWWENGDENLVYDNGVDTALGGGSVVIHTKK